MYPYQLVYSIIHVPIHINTALTLGASCREHPDDHSHSNSNHKEKRETVIFVCTLKIFKFLFNVGASSRGHTDDRYHSNNDNRANREDHIDSRTYERGGRCIYLFMFVNMYVYVCIYIYIYV